MNRLFHHIDQITRQRDRMRAEASLVGALFELLGARRVSFYRLFMPPGDRLTGLMCAVDAKGIHMHNDSFSWPADIVPIERLPHLENCLLAQAPTLDNGPARRRRLTLPVPYGATEPFGFVCIEGAAADMDMDLAAGFVALFNNHRIMLDYSEIDSLTGLYNRKTFDESLMKILSHLNNTGDDPQATRRLPARRKPRPQAEDHWLGVMDIDHFKRINDQFGHLIGDEVLLLIANVMKLSFRTQDKLFRFGGEEFVVLLKPSEVNHAFATFERFREKVGNYGFPQVGQVTISIGFARIRLYDTPSLIIDNADEALYFAKEHGRNQVCSYEALLDAGLLAKHATLHTEADLF